MKYLWLFMISLQVLLLPVRVRGQAFNVTAYDIESGLVQSQVMTMTQDRWGYLWFGTHRGINRFDGSNFIAFGKDDGLTGTFLNSLLEDRKGYLWIGSDAGLNRFDGFRFEDFSRKPGMEDKVVEVLMEDSDGNIWVGTKSSGIILIRENEITPAPFEWQGPEEKNILSLVEDKTGRIWIGTSNGLFVKDQSDQIRPINNLPHDENLEVFSIVEDSAETIWVGTNQGLFQYDGINFNPYNLLKGGFQDNNIYCMIADDQKRIWLGTGKGILLYKDGKITQVASNNRQLDFQIKSAVLDNEGNLWFGTDGGGVRRITEGVFETIDMYDGLTSNLAKSFLEDRTGNIWISTKDRGVNVFNDKGELKQQYHVRNGLGGDDICYSFEDSKGNFWFASYNGTLTRYNGRSFRVFDAEDGLDCNAAYCVGEDLEGNIWVGTDNGLFRLDSKYQFTQYNAENGLPDNIVYSIEPDHTGTLWIGTSLGIGRFSEGKITAFKEANSIGSNVITLLEDSRNRMWVGSSSGLAYFYEGKDYPVRISGADGAHTVVGLVIQDERYLWVATERGAYRLDFNDYETVIIERAKFEHYTRDDGLPSMECNANAAFRDSKDNIWIGTSAGAIFKKKENEREDNVYPPRVYITQVRSADSANWVQARYMADGASPPESPPRLAPNDNKVDFRFIGISLKNPKQVEYKFQLEGVEDSWSESYHLSTHSYAHLDPGAYTFKVVAKKESESWNYDDPAVFDFYIEPPVWQTWWFITLMSILVLSLIAGIYWSISNRRKQQREKQLIADTADKLQLEHQALYAMMNPHFTFNALQSIQYFIHRQDKKAANKFLSSFAKLIRKNLESTKSDFISLGEEVERLKLYLSLEKMRFPEKFDYEVIVEPGIEIHDTQIPPMLLQPFVENSIKHGIMPLDANGEITVSISSKGDDYLTITIRDNGIGIEASKRQKADRPNDHVSKGMQITLDRLALFARMTGKKYSLDIREAVDPEGKVIGTVVEMLLPVKQVFSEELY